MKTLDTRDYLYANFFELKKAYTVIFEELEIMKLHAKGYNKIHTEFKKFFNDELSVKEADHFDSPSNNRRHSTSQTENSPQRSKNSQSPRRQSHPTNEDEIEDEIDRRKALRNMIEIPDLYRGFDQKDLSKGSEYITKVEGRLTRSKECLDILKTQFDSILDYNDVLEHTVGKLSSIFKKFYPALKFLIDQKSYFEVDNLLVKNLTNEFEDYRNHCKENKKLWDTNFKKIFQKNVEETKKDTKGQLYLKKAIPNEIFNNFKEIELDNVVDNYIDLEATLSKINDANKNMETKFFTNLKDASENVNLKSNTASPIGPKDNVSVQSNQYSTWVRSDFNGFLKAEGNYLNTFLMTQVENKKKLSENMGKSLTQYEDEINYRAYMISYKTEQINFYENKCDTTRNIKENQKQKISQIFNSIEKTHDIKEGTLQELSTNRTVFREFSVKNGIVDNVKSFEKLKEAKDLQTQFDKYADQVLNFDKMVSLSNEDRQVLDKQMLQLKESLRNLKKNLLNESEKVESLLNMKVNKLNSTLKAKYEKRLSDKRKSLIDNLSIRTINYETQQSGKTLNVEFQKSQRTLNVENQKSQITLNYETQKSGKTLRDETQKSQITLNYETQKSVKTLKDETQKSVKTLKDETQKSERTLKDETQKSEIKNKEETQKSNLENMKKTQNSGVENNFKDDLNNRLQG